MLYQTDIYTRPCDTSGLLSDISVKLHGAAMKLIPRAYAEKMHTDMPHPFSVFAVPSPEGGFVIRISALCDEARVIPDVLACSEKLDIYGIPEPLVISRTETLPPVAAADIGKYISQKKIRIDMITPATVKTNGRFSCRPDIPLFFYSVINKYNRFENDNIHFNDFRDAFDMLDITDLFLKSEYHNVSGIRIRGLVGYFEAAFSQDPDANALLRKILAYASYSGIGGKTGMGMGGIIIR